MAENKLTGILRERRISQHKLAEAIGMGDKLLSMKINGKTGWTWMDVLRICDYLEIENPREVFL